jgi:phage tail sheath protein FI
MPEYLAPGVYVEEVSFSAPTIEGVGTTTTGFAGPTLTGPVAGMPFGGWPAGAVLASGLVQSGGPAVGTPAGGIPQLLTSFGDFQNVYGGYEPLSFTASATLPNQVNYMAMAVKAFFDNGGQNLYVSRVFSNNPGAGGVGTDPGIASATLNGITVSGRFPGAFLNGQQVIVSLTAQKTQNIANLPVGSMLGVPGAPAQGGNPATTPAFYVNSPTGSFTLSSNVATPLPTPLPANLYLLTMQAATPGANGQQMVYSSLGFDPAGSNYIGDVLGTNPPRAIDQLQNQVWFNVSGAATAVALFGDLFPVWNDPASTVPKATLTTPPATFTFPASGVKNCGDDGAEPNSGIYGTALSYFLPLEDIAIVATPGVGAYADTTIQETSLIVHVESQRAYRVGILETPPAQLAAGFELVRAQIDSSYAALYVPWVITPNPLAVSGTSTPAQIAVPPTGFMAGIYARNDQQNSVAKAPANEVVLGAVDFERHIAFAEQATLNPVGINCLRYFPDRGYLVWGARTVSSDTSMMYVNARRMMVYLEHSIDNGTQWAVFENNGPTLWARVSDSIDSFLNNEYAKGNLLGTSPSSSYFVRCDRTTMTQNDLDNGRLICIIGVALLKPAEFVIFRIGQMTASAQS